MILAEILLTEKEVQEALASLPVKGPFGKMVKINADGSIKASVSITAVEASPQAEIHDNFNDTFVVFSGEEELWVGGEISDKRETEPGEWVGETLVGAHAQKLKAGDTVVIPKGVAHRHGLGSIKLLIIKTR